MDEINTQDILFNHIYLAMDHEQITKTFLDVLGETLDAWYKVSQQRIEGGGWREENMFLTPRKIVRSIATPERVSFITYKRTELLSVEKIFNISGGRTSLLTVEVTLSEHGDFELPVPNKDLVDYGDQHGNHLNFINELTQL